MAATNSVFPFLYVRTTPLLSESLFLLTLNLWLLRPTEGSKSDILGLLSWGSKKTCHFYFLPLSIQQSCCEKSKSRGEATCGHSGQWPWLSCRLTACINYSYMDKLLDVPASSNPRWLKCQSTSLRAEESPSWGQASCRIVIVNKTAVVLSHQVSGGLLHWSR